MKKTLSVIVILVLVFSSFSMLTPHVKAERIIRVPDDYQTIQDAINAANPGDTILVSSGTYYENIIVNKSISLIGEEPTNTILKGESDHKLCHQSEDKAIFLLSCFCQIGYRNLKDTRKTYLCHHHRSH